MSDAEPSRPRRPFQFGLATLLLGMGLLSVLAAALGGLLRNPMEAVYPRSFYVAMAAAAPMGVLIVISIFHAVARRFRRDRQGSTTEPTENDTAGPKP